jgi:hypothetical protein
MLSDIYDRRFALVPFSIQRAKHAGVLDLTYIGWYKVRVFGVLVAKIQGTSPWD